MSKFIFILALVVIFNSCVITGSDKDYSNLEKKCVEKLEEVNVKAIVSIKGKEDILNVDIVFENPLITHKDHSEVILSWLVGKLSDFESKKKILFNYSVSDSELHSTREAQLSYDVKKIKQIRLLYSDSIFSALIEYCISNFGRYTIYHLEESLKFLNTNMPGFTFNLPFFEILSLFYQESKNLKEGNKASNTLILLRAISMDLGKGTDTETLGDIIFDLWKIGNNENIDIAEKRMKEEMRSM